MTVKKYIRSWPYVVNTYGEFCHMTVGVLGAYGQPENWGGRVGVKESDGVAVMFPNVGHYVLNLNLILYIVTLG